MCLLTGHEKLIGSRTLPPSLLTFCREKLFPPNTGVEAEPKVQKPNWCTSCWYSFKHTLKKVSHWSTSLHRWSLDSLDLSQQAPLCSRPLTFCIDTIWISNCPEDDDIYRDRQKDRERGHGLPLTWLNPKRSPWPLESRTLLARSC